MNRIVTLGTKGGPAIRARGAMPTSSLLELDGRRIVIDAGLGVAKGLVEAGMDLRDLDLVFITHLHSDHVLELGPLLHTAWTTGLRAPVTVWGPAGTDDYWQGFLASMAFDCAIRVRDEGRVPLDRMVRLRTYAEGAVMAEGGLMVRAAHVPHPPVEEAYALRFEGSRVVTFSGDTAYHPPLADFARGSDALVHEAMLPEGIEAIIAKTGLGDALRQHLHESHSTVEQAAAIARDAGVGHLVLNHLIPVDDDRFTQADWLSRVAAVWPGRTTLGRDGLEVLL